MKKQILKEIVESKGQLIKEALPKGILCRVRYPICNIGELNRNHRIYEREVWENRVLKDPEIIEKLKNRTLFGEAEHPEESVLKLNKDTTSHIISNIFIKENRVYAELDILPTEAGKFIAVLLEADCKVGTSTRAEGELEEKIDEKTGDKYYRVIPEAYKFITVDFTGDPSTIGALPEDVRHNIVKTTEQKLKKNEINREVAVALLESVGTEEAKKVCASLRDGECVIKNREIDEAWKDHPDPSGFMKASHSPENVVLVWWYNPSTGAFIKDSNTEAKHSDALNQGIIDPDDIQNWVRGRVFNYQDKNYLIIYWPQKKKLASSQLLDILDKANNSVKKPIVKIIDDNGDDLSCLLESKKYLEENIFNDIDVSIQDQLKTGKSENDILKGILKKYPKQFNEEKIASIKNRIKIYKQNLKQEESKQVENAESIQEKKKESLKLDSKIQEAFDIIKKASETIEGLKEWLGNPLYINCLAKEISKIEENRDKYFVSFAVNEEFHPLFCGVNDKILKEKIDQKYKIRVHIPLEENKTKFICLECGHKFTKKIGPNTYEVECPKCGSIDVEVNERKKEKKVTVKEIREGKIKGMSEKNFKKMLDTLIEQKQQEIDEAVNDLLYLKKLKLQDKQLQLANKMLSTQDEDI